ncbi:MAG: hypothetical protein V7776_22230 [Halopseudomonas aestusnigri]
MAFRKVQTLIGMAIFLFFVTARSQASEPQNLVISIAELPVLAENKNKGILVELIQAMDKALGTSTTIKVLPFRRSIKTALAGGANAHLPFIVVKPAKSEGQFLKYSKAKMFDVAFVMYALKDRNLSKGVLSGLKVETLQAHVDVIPHAVFGSNCIVCSLKRLQSRRIDAFIFAQKETDQELKKLGYLNVRRSLYNIYDVRAVLAPGKAGEDADQFLTNGIEALKANGEYKRIMAPFLDSFVEW